jgi:hypothetical protein
MKEKDPFIYIFLNACYDIALPRPEKNCICGQITDFEHIYSTGTCKIKIIFQQSKKSAGCIRQILCSKQNLYPGFPLFRCILSLIQVYIVEIYVKFCVFWYQYTPHCEKNGWPLYSSMYCMTPTRYDLRAWGRLIKTNFKNFPNIYTYPVLRH